MSYEQARSLLGGNHADWYMIKATRDQREIARMGAWYCNNNEAFDAYNALNRAIDDRQHANDN